MSTLLEEIQAKCSTELLASRDCAAINAAAAGAADNFTLRAQCETNP